MVDRMISQAERKLGRLDTGRSYQSVQSGGDQQIEQQQRLEFLEMQNNDLETEMETAKTKARGLLMQKELQERRLKIIIQKLEAYMKNNLEMAQDQVNQIGSLTQDELQMLYEMERDIEGEIQQELDELAEQN